MKTSNYSKKAVEDIEKTGKICVLDVELQGVKNIKNSHLNARYILIRAPTLQILVIFNFDLVQNIYRFQEQRLRARGTEKEEAIAMRLKHAKEDQEESRNSDLFS